MNRKKFILISAVIASGVAVPLIMRWNRTTFKNPLVHPWFLAHLFDKKTIRGIGVAYMAKISSEHSSQQLTQLLLENPTGKEVAATDDSAVKELLEKKVHTDFATNNLVVADGWILSVTEARQCALFSLTEN